MPGIRDQASPSTMSVGNGGKPTPKDKAQQGTQPASIGQPPAPRGTIGCTPLHWRFLRSYPLVLTRLGGRTPTRPGWVIGPPDTGMLRASSICTFMHTTGWAWQSRVPGPRDTTVITIKPRGNKEQVQVQETGPRSRRQVTVIKTLLVVHFSHHLAASKPAPIEGLDGLVSL